MLGVATIALRAAGCTVHKPAAEPISRWELDETSSAEGVFEDRGSAHVLMVHSGDWADLTTDSLVEGAGGTSAYTAGAAYATLPANVAAHNLAALTISLYYQRESAVEKHILLAAGNGNEPGDFSLEVLANGRLRGYHTGQDGLLRFFEDTNGVTGTDLQVGTAHRIDLSLGPQGARLYLDGAELPAAAIPENSNGWNNTRVKYLGRWTDGVQAPAVGVFDRVRIWNRQLTGAEIAELEPAQSISLPVPPDQGVMLQAPLTAFGHTRVQVTSLPGWPAGRVPKQVTSQGALAHAYVRRSWKPGQNDGTWMDFQAGWQNGTGDAVAVKLDDDSLIDIKFDVQATIPTPGPGGTTRTLDKLGGGNFTTWAAAIGACNNNDVLVVRARAGGEVYPVDVQVGGATNTTANGVKVVAHPEDVAAGRRPRVHIQGTTFARYADELNSGHWEVYQDLGAAHGKVWRTTQVVGTDKVVVGVAYRTASGEIRRTYNYTNTPNTPGALARLTDTTYPRVTGAPNVQGSELSLYLGPGHYLHSDGRIYIRLSPLTATVGAKAVNAAAGLGPNPPWNWTEHMPASDDPNQVQLYITSSNAETLLNNPSTNISYGLRITGRSGWTVENIDFVGGGNVIEAYSASNLTLRGCRMLGYVSANTAQDAINFNTFVRAAHFIEAYGASTIICDRCEFWGGQVPWYDWRDNKGTLGAYGLGMQSRLFYLAVASGTWPGDIRFVNCVIQGFPYATWTGGRQLNFKFHQCRLAEWGMDGAFVCQTPRGTLDYVRCQMFNWTYSGWSNQTEPSDGTMYFGYNLCTNFRPFLHDSGYWNDAYASDNVYMCGGSNIGHETYREIPRHYYYNNTSIGAHNHRYTAAVKNSGGSLVGFGPGAGASMWPSSRNNAFIEWISRNNVCAVFPNGSFGSERAAWGPGLDSHVGVIFHPNHVGWTRSGFVGYSSNYNIYYRAPGMPTLSGQRNGVITTVTSGTTENQRNSITDVRSDTGQENNGSIENPLFVGSWDVTKLDAELHNNAFWCLQSGSPAASGGDTTDRSWRDLDFGEEITYGGNSWRGCMDPDASAVEQQVGPLGPMPSGL